MAIETLYKSSLDKEGKLFTDKKAAAEHDAMLELAANLTALLEQEIGGLSEDHAEEIGLLLAKRRDSLAKACKGNSDLLLAKKESEAGCDSADSKVTELKSA